jgi:hypothetical protein
MARAAKRLPIEPVPLRGDPRDRLLARVAFEATWERALGGSLAVSWVERVDRIIADAIHSGDWGLVERVSPPAKDGSWAWSRGAIQRDSGGERCAPSAR